MIEIAEYMAIAVIFTTVLFSIWVILSFSIPADWIEKLHLKIRERRIKNVYKKYKHLYEFLPFDFVIAGGTLRDYFLKGKINKKVDIDIFFTSQDEIDKAREWIKSYLDERSNGWGWKRIWSDIENQTPVLELFGTNVNFILFKVYDNPMELIDSFDFTVCAVALYHDKLFFNNLFFQDLDNKKITILNLRSHTDRLSRLLKYKGKGFIINRDVVMQVIGEINKKANDIFSLFYRDNVVSLNIPVACKALGINITCKLKRIHNGR